MKEGLVDVKLTKKEYESLKLIVEAYYGITVIPKPMTEEEKELVYKAIISFL